MFWPYGCGVAIKWQHYQGIAFAPFRLQEDSLSFTKIVGRAIVGVGLLLSTTLAACSNGAPAIPTTRSSSAGDSVQEPRMHANCITALLAKRAVRSMISVVGPCPTDPPVDPITSPGQCFGTCYGNGGGGGIPIAYPGHKAHYGDQCTAGTLSIGQEVPGFGDAAHLANGTWSVNMGNPNQPGTVVTIGYVYPTLGGTAYFVPINSAINVWVFGLTINSSVPVGNDAQASDFNHIMNVISQFIHNGNITSTANCFPGGNWDGTYPTS